MSLDHPPLIISSNSPRKENFLVKTKRGKADIHPRVTGEAVHTVSKTELILETAGKNSVRPYSQRWRPLDKNVASQERCLPRLISEFPAQQKSTKLVLKWGGMRKITVPRTQSSTKVQLLGMGIRGHFPPLWKYHVLPKAPRKRKAK